VNASPLEADQFAESEAGPHGDKDHRRIGFQNELHKIGELLGCDGLFRAPAPPIFGQFEPFDRVPAEIATSTS
jgi:hypothetical protein